MKRNHFEFEYVSFSDDTNGSDVDKSHILRPVYFKQDHRCRTYDDFIVFLMYLIPVLCVLCKMYKITSTVLL